MLGVGCWSRGGGCWSLVFGVLRFEIEVWNLGLRFGVWGLVVGFEVRGLRAVGHQAPRPPINVE